jgi:hypothetical protein
MLRCELALAVLLLATPAHAIDVAHAPPAAHPSRVAPARSSRPRPRSSGGRSGRKKRSGRSGRRRQKRSGGSRRCLSACSAVSRPRRMVCASQIVAIAAAAENQAAVCAVGPQPHSGLRQGIDPPSCSRCLAPAAPFPPAWGTRDDLSPGTTSCPGPMFCKLCIMRKPKSHIESSPIPSSASGF